MNTNLKIPLYSQKDKHDRIFYVGKLKGPFNINAKDGVVFLIFVADDGSEELQIANMDKE